MFLYWADFVVIIGFLPLLLYWLYGKRKALPHSHLFLPFLGLVFFASVYELVVTSMFRVDSTIWFKIYTILEFYVLLLVFDRLFAKKLRKLYVGFGVAFLIILGLLVFTDNFTGFMQGDGYLNSLTSLLVLLSSILWFINSVVRFQKEKIWEHPHFYFISALLLYFCGTYFLFLFAEVFISKGEDEFIASWYINLFFVFILRVSMAYGLWVEWKR